jgi:hypothetical protein
LKKGGQGGFPNQPLHAPPSPDRSDNWPAIQAEFFSAITSAHDDASEHYARAPVATERGLRVYRDGYLARLQRGLRENFRALATVIGAAEFDALIAAYVAAHPPCGWAFADAGVALPAFIATHDFRVNFGVPRQVLTELAALEQAELEVHEAPDDGPALSTDALAAIDPERWPALRVHCAAALRLVHGAFDVLDVVESVARGAAPTRPLAGRVAYLICRPETEVLRLRLEGNEALVIASLIAGGTIAEACAEADPAVGATAVARLATLGLLRGIASSR